MKTRALARWALPSVLVVVLLIASSCSSSAEPESSNEAVAEDELDGEAVVVPEAPVDSVAAELRADTTPTDSMPTASGLIDCVESVEGEDDVGHRSDTFLATQLWLQVDGFTSENATPSEQNSGQTTAQVRRVVDGVVADDVETVSILLLGSEPDVLAAALTDPAVESTYLGVSPSFPELTDTDFTVWQVFSTLAGGGGSHVGGCSAGGLNGYVAIEHGPELTSYANGFLSHTGDGLVKFVEGRPDPATDTIALVNSSSVDEETLGTLTSVTIFYSIEGQVADRTICTLTSAGWNECISLATGEGIVVPAYIADDGVLQFYLHDGSGIRNRPLALLETIEFGSTFLQFADPIVRIDIDAVSAASEEFTNSVSIGKTADFSIEIDDDPYWQVD